jgi:hypothetical protein
VGVIPKTTPARIDDRKITSGEKMRRNTSIAILGLVLLFGNAVSSAAQVKRVQMHIAGYLCGN